MMLKKLFTLKQFRVFNIAQCSDIQPCREIPTGSEDNLDIQPIDSAEAIVNGYKNAPKIVERPQGSAYYTPQEIPSQCRLKSSLLSVPR